IEIVAVAALIAILAAITLPSVSEMIVRNRITAEDAAMKNMAASIKESFESTDFTANLATFVPQNFNGVEVPIEVWGPDMATPIETFSYGSTTTSFAGDRGMNSDTELGYLTFGDEWFLKLARHRGVYVTASGGQAVDRQSNPELAKLAFNASNRPRLL